MDKSQILTIADLLKGHGQVQMPPEYQTFKQAPRVRETVATQVALFSGGEADE